MHIPLLRNPAKLLSLLILLSLPLIGGLTMSFAPFSPPALGQAAARTTVASNPILFVTQVPVPADFTTIGSVFGNHQGALNSVTRGGDLWIRYADGSLKNLTRAAGYGDEGMQGANAIAVRDPAVHWDGQKALFSMVIGAPTQQYQVATYYWQIYEITGLGKAETPVITKVAHQPANYNNITPIYGTDDHILFTTDRPRSGERHLYPQLDEYEEAPTVSGLWRLDPINGELVLLNHAPSGDFTPIIDSFGRVLFTQWDHLQRDQQADNDAQGGNTYNTFNWSDESAQSTADYTDRTEVFPEPRASRTDLLAGTNLNGHSFNHFLPWQIFEDGTEVETLNHLGRHELQGYLAAAMNDDPNIVEYYGQYSRTNPNHINNMLQVKEDPTVAGRYYGIDAPEFATHAAGQVILLDAPPATSADQVTVTYVTHRDTANTSDAPSADHSGLYRDVLPLADGTVVVAHTAETRGDTNTGSREAPASRYDFRLKQLVQGGNGSWQAGAALTNGISETVTFWDPDVLVTYSGPLWEWQPVEVRARPRPARLHAALPGPESKVFAAVGVAPESLRAYLEANNLALIVSRNVTVRDDLDRQQPFNLRVPGGVQTLGTAVGAENGTLYDVTHLQLFQADQLRGIRFNSETPRAGRRVLAQYLHEEAAMAANPVVSGAPQSSVVVASDGSVAAFVPARRALTWQLTDSAGTGVVRERNWITFQPGEMRVCAACHGLSDKDQAGQTMPTNEPKALRTLLEHWKAGQDPNATPVATPTPTATATLQPTATPTPTATPKPTTAPPLLGNCAIFFGDNIWNTPIEDLPIAANSAAYIDTIGRDRAFHPDFGAGEWPPDSGAPIGIPYVTVPGNQKKVAVSFDYADESDAGPYPIPANPPIEGGVNGEGDRHILMLDSDNCTLYELYAAYPQPDGSWQAGSGAIFDLSSHLLRPAGWTSADAAGLPILPGLLRYDEVAAGEIRHALRFTAPQTQRAYVWPARHFASSLTDSAYPPMGQRFRLRADFDISGFSPQIQVILVAMQRYGIILADNGSAWYLSGAPDERWDNDLLRELKQLTGNDFEAVDVSALMQDSNSGQVQQSTALPLNEHLFLPVVMR